MPAGQRRITAARPVEIEPGQASIGLTAQFRDATQAEGPVNNQIAYLDDTIAVSPVYLDELTQLPDNSSIC